MELTDNKEKQAALDLAEDSRQTEWQHKSFAGEIFKGNFLWDLIYPFPNQDAKDKEIGDTVLKELESLLKTHIDPAAVDQTGVVPPSALKALGDAGYFGMKIPKKYGGMGLSVTNYVRAMALVGSYCGSTAVWLSAHQSIGIPQPLYLYGTDEQKEKYLPRVAKGAISAFALTEPDVGSDPAKMSTTATPTEDGNFYLINGEKLYITNGPAAELLVVMAVTPSITVNGKEKKQITAFIVETNSPGFEVKHECTFMGIRGIRNGWLNFKDLKVPKENIIGKPGEGLRIALATLNTGRLTIPAISAAAGKSCIEMAGRWSKKRVQWGDEIGKHQAVEVKLAKIVADTFAMEAISQMTAALADVKSVDIRLEAAMAKYFGSEKSWTIADETLQIRGGRGFENESSLKARGEDVFPVERMLRDLRINRIIEGTSEVMQLFIAREAMDVHLSKIFPLLNPKTSIGDKLKAALNAGRFYACWYPKQWIYLPCFKKAPHLNREANAYLGYIQRSSKRLARTLFHTMAKYQTKLEKEQVLLANFVDIGTLLVSMAATISHADHAVKEGNKTAEDAALYFCETSKIEIERLFRDLGKGPKGLMKKISNTLLDDGFDWMLTDIVRLTK